MTMNTENTNLTVPGNLSADWLAKLAEAAKATQLVEKAASSFFSGNPDVTALRRTTRWSASRCAQHLLLQGRA
jgi:hypothetical protein